MQSLSLLKRLFALDDVPVAAGASDLQPDRISRSGEQSLPAAASPHQPGAHPDPPHPDLAHSRRHHPAKAKVKFPLRNRILNQEVRLRRRILNPAQGLESGRDAGEVRVMTCIRV